MEKLSFKGLVDKYAVVIPMLQRDYAYGRPDEAEKRENFLRKLKQYIEDPTPHELDFVYGSVDRKGCLKLLDGQQRITTLFLLHWYLSLIKDSRGDHHFDDFRKTVIFPDGESKFSYKTRFSATDFCNAIANLKFKGIDRSEKYAEIINNRSSKISAIISREKWFLPHWNYDPTITGMLNMLDSIMSFFAPDDCRGYYSKLVGQDQLLFNFLNLDDFNLTDELYIKMNSRGRALTGFENLKSKMLKLYDDAGRREPQKYSEMLAKVNSISSGSYSSLRDYVSYMMNTKWADVFWNEWLQTPDHEEKPNVDDMMFSFISTMAIFDHIVFRLAGRLSLGRKEELTKEINDLMNDKDKNKGVTIRYDKLIEMFTENDYAFLFNIIDYFNIFNDNGKLKTYLPVSFRLFDEHEAFLYLANDYKYGMEYERKAKIFAYIKYLSLNPQPDRELFGNWMRFVCHICSNSYNLANYTDAFCTSLAGLNYLYDRDIAKAIMNKDLSVIVTLDIPQIEEEILKIKLSANADWKTAIDDAESRLSYFEGSLRYPLMECCQIDESHMSDPAGCSRFEKYVEKMAAIFPNETGCDCENELIKALLAKGNYLMYFSSSNTLLKNADRDNSWRRYLKEKPDAYHPFGPVGCDERSFFKEILDDPVFDPANVKGSLNSIAKSRDDSIPMWRKLIIDCEDILENTDVMALGKDRFIRWNNDVTEYPHKKDSEDNFEIDLIPGSAITGYHAELFSLAKYYELKGKTFNTWGQPEYARAKTSIEQPYFYFGEAEQPYVKVMYQDDDSFRFVFSNGKERPNVAYADVENALLEANIFIHG